MNFITDEEFSKLTTIFKMFADQTRLYIFYELNKQSLSVTELSNKLNMSQSSVSHQLATLRKLNLVSVKRKGQMMVYSLSDYHIMNIFLQALEHIRE